MSDQYEKLEYLVGRKKREQRPGDRTEEIKARDKLELTLVDLDREHPTRSLLQSKAPILNKGLEQVASQ